MHGVAIGGAQRPGINRAPPAWFRWRRRRRAHGTRAFVDKSQGGRRYSRAALGRLTGSRAPRC